MLPPLVPLLRRLWGCRGVGVSQRKGRRQRRSGHEHAELEQQVRAAVAGLMAHPPPVPHHGDAAAEGGSGEGEGGGAELQLPYAVAAQVAQLVQRGVIVQEPVTSTTALGPEGNL